MKRELLAQLGENHDQIRAAVAGLTEEQIATVRVTDQWTVKDVVGHMAYWEGVMLDHIREAYAEGRPRPMPDDPNDDAINPREAAKRADWPWARVLAEFEHVRAAMIAKVAALDESALAFQVPSPWWQDQRIYPVEQMIREDTVGHCREHLEQIERGKASMGA